MRESLPLLGSRRPRQGCYGRQDLVDEQIHSLAGIIRMINHNYSGNANKEVRAQKTARVQAVEDTTKCMLDNMDSLISGAGATTLTTRSTRAARTRTAASTCSTTCSAASSWTAQRRAARRSSGRTTGTSSGVRVDGETAPQWAARLVDESGYRGNDKPLDATSAQLKLKYITGSNLSVSDPLVSVVFRLEVAEGERVQDKTLKDLQRWLAYMITLEPARSNQNRVLIRFHSGRQPTKDAPSKRDRLPDLYIIVILHHAAKARSARATRARSKATSLRRNANRAPRAAAMRRAASPKRATRRQSNIGRTFRMARASGVEAKTTSRRTARKANRRRTRARATRVPSPRRGPSRAATTSARQSTRRTRPSTPTARTR
jgi:hypothetical protein